ALPAAAEAAPAAVAETLSRARARGKMTEEEEAAARRRLSVAPSLSAARGVDLVIEAAPESLDVKRALFSELDGAPEPFVLATNTSSLSIRRIASATSRPERVLGLHFFNPAPVMPLVEIVVAPETSAATREIAL